MDSNYGHCGEITRYFYLDLNETNVTQTLLVGSVFTCIVVNFTTSLTACFGNVLLVIAILTNTNLQSNGNYLIASLASVDFLVGFILQPLHAAYQLQFILGRSCSLFVAYRIIMLILVFLSLLNTLMVSCERCLAVLFPTRYRAGLKKWKLFLPLGTLNLAWIVLICLQLCGVLNYDTIRLFASSTFICITVIVAILYALMNRVSRRHRVQIAAQHKASGKRNSLVKENRVFKTAVLVVTALVICYLPISIVWFLDTTTTFEPKSKILYFMIVETLVYLNSTLNVLVYGCRSGEIRQSVMRILRRRRFRRVQPSSDTNSYTIKSTKST